MDAQGLRLFITGIFAAFLFSCTSTPTSVQPAQRMQSTTTQATQPTPPVSTEPTKQATQQQTPPAASEQSSSSQSQGLIKKGEILVTKEEYKRTFDDVRQLISELNRVIAARDYEAWTKHLTSAYVKTYSDPKTLDELSNQPMLRRQNLHLTSLKDYFLNVVVPSRADARLDDLEFTSKTQVKAITVIDGQRYILYDLRFQDGTWKIGVS